MQSDRIVVLLDNHCFDCNWSANNSTICICRGESAPNLPVDMRPLPKEPDSDERKKKTLKSKMKVKENKDKPNISYPTNFEHTVHVGFDAVTGEFTVGSSDSRICTGRLSTPIIQSALA